MNPLLPDSYLRFSTHLREVTGAETTAWFGDVGFFVPRSTDLLQSWIIQLARRRWTGMHPDLVPFAADGAGNLFCFVLSAATPMRDTQAVVLWMYETYRCVPVASSFDLFVAWIGITSFAAVRRGNIAILDAAGYDLRILPLLDRFDLATDFHVLLPEPYPSNTEVSRAFLRIDPEAPASLVLTACRLGQSANELRGLAEAQHALEVFPHFGAAALAAGRIHELHRDRAEAHAAYRRALRSPLTYSGDSMMPFLSEVPELDLEELTTKLANDPGFDDPYGEWASLELILDNDPNEPEPWLHAAVDAANDQQLEQGVTFAANALHLTAQKPETAMESISLLLELYEALGWSWHHRLLERELEVRAEAAPISKKSRR